MFNKKLIFGLVIGVAMLFGSMGTYANACEPEKCPNTCDALDVVMTSLDDAADKIDQKSLRARFSARRDLRTAMRKIARAKYELVRCGIETIDINFDHDVNLFNPFTILADLDIDYEYGTITNELLLTAAGASIANAHRETRGVIDHDAVNDIERAQYLIDMVMDHLNCK